MSVRTKTVVTAICSFALIGVSALAGAQPYYGNPLTGAGSTLQSKQLPYQNQQPRQTYKAPTYSPSVTDRYGNQFMYVPELGNWVPTQLSPQTAKRIGDAVGNCASRAPEGAAWGFAGGGTRGAIVGGIQGCFNR